MSGGRSGEGTILFGGSGFLGGCILDRCPEMVSVGRTRPPTGNRHVHVDDLSDLSPLEDLEFDKVIYIIGNTDRHQLEVETVPRGEPTAFDHHVVPLLHAMEQLKHRPLKKFIHFSTILVYDEKRIPDPVSEDAPIDPYRNRYVLSKYLAEEACKFYGRWVPIINVRVSNMYGPTQLARYDLTHLLIHKLLDEGHAQVWTTRPERDFIYVEDAGEAVVELLDANYTGTLNLGTGTATPVRRIVETLEELTGARITDLGRPITGPAHFRCDMTRLESLIDWRPRVSVGEGVRRTFEQMRAWKQAQDPLARERS
jgi:nucleoside-diphosphate-sugar epimerase